MRTRMWLVVLGGCVLTALNAGCGDDSTTPIGQGAVTAGGAAATAGATALMPMTPYLGAAGIGVSNLDASYDFYTKVLGMTMRYELAVPNYVNEKILYYPGSKPAGDVVLMTYTDGQQHNYAGNPVKLVFYVPNAANTLNAIRGRGLRIISEPAPQPAFNNVIIGLGTDPDGYILEIIEDPTLTVPYLGAVGIGVADLEKSREFYTRVMGMNPVGSLIQVPGAWDEWIMQHKSSGSAIVLMHWTDGSTKNYTNNPIKTVHFVADAAGLTGNVAKEGLQVLSQPMSFNVQGVNALIGLARDPDGYVLEIVTTQ